MANSRPNRVSRTRTSAQLALTLAAALGSAPIATSDVAHAQGTSKKAAAAPIVPGPGFMSLVSLNRQRIYLYDANGLLTQSRVSTGVSGHDTPIGIYSVLQKKKEHASNIYEGASMPFMQRLLWTGIAMHAGDVPSTPASHGCVRLPYQFAKQYFDLTAYNHRVIVTPEVKAPIPFAHRLLPSSLPRGDQASAPAAMRFAEAKPQHDFGYGRSLLDRFEEPVPGQRTLASVAAERAAEHHRLIAASEAAQDAFDRLTGSDVAPAAALAAARAAFQQARASEAPAMRAAEKAIALERAAVREHAEFVRRNAQRAPRLRAEPYFAMKADEARRLERVERIVALSQEAQRQHASQRFAAEGRARLLAAAEKAYIEAKMAISNAAQAAATAKATLGAYALTERNRPRPLSILISSATGRISLRQGLEPLGEDSVEIDDPTQGLGTYVFTATRWKDESQTALEWMVVSADERGERAYKYSTNADAMRLPKPTDAAAAAAALERIRIPAHILARMSEEVKPGSSLIISDYDMSRSETGGGTDFIVQMPEVVATTTPVAERRGSNRRVAELTSPIYTYDALDYPSGEIRSKKKKRSAKRNKNSRREYAIYRPERITRSRPSWRSISFDYLD